jgi:DNA polymerase-1
MARIVLLDGYSLLFRGFFGMRALTTTDGTPTNALYSLALMSLAVLDRFKPDGVVCAFDAHVATFRHIELESYKAQRPETPDELKQQAPLARDLVKACGFQLLEEPGFEADDVIGTLAAMGKMAGHEIDIVTGDLDSLQLVDDAHGPVRIVTTVKGLTETVIYDEAAVMARYGLKPSQIPDFKGLKGDSSDNLPGIPGVGEKTASKLLIEYGSVEALFDSLASMKDEKLKAKIEPYRDQALQCKRLATIVCDVPLPGFEFLVDYQRRGADMEKLRALFERLEFRTLLRRFRGEPAPKQTQRNYEPPKEASAQASFEFDSSSVAGLPTGIVLIVKEPPGKADVATATPVGLAIAAQGESARYVAWDAVSDRERKLLADAAVPKATYDAKLLIGVLGRHGIDVAGVEFDVLLAAYLINSGRSGYPLEGIAADYLSREIAPDGFSGMADAVRGLAPVLRARMKQDSVETIHDEIELPLSRVLADLERVGVSIDPSWLGELGKQMESSLKEVDNEITNLAGEKFAIGSTKQLQYILFEKLGLPAGKKTKTGYSTDAEVLEGLAGQGFDIAAKILQWREISKLKSTYVDALPTLIDPRDGRVHTTLNQTVASTGRLSSSNPNLQNIPIRSEIGREIRKAFVAGPGHVLVAADYSQIELRLFAFMTRDPELVSTFMAGGDIHRRTGSIIFGVPESEVTTEQRRRAKTINFAVIYGMSAFRLAIELGVSQQVASEWRKRYFENYPGVKQYAEQTLEVAREKGYVQTLLGRRRYVPDINSRVFQFRQAAEREAVNMPVQGTAADIIKLAMLKVDAALREEGLVSKMILQVHDELLFECPLGEMDRLSALVSRAMSSAYPLGDIPLRADVKVGSNWSEMTELNARA